MVMPARRSMRTSAEEFRKERFLHRYHLTVDEALGTSWAQRTYACSLLVELARAEFGFPAEAKPTEILKSLRLARHRIRRRKRGWYKRIHLAPIDLEPER